MPSPANERLRRIISPQNNLVKELRRAFTRGERTPDGYCAIESVRIIEEAIRSGLRFRALFVSESAEVRAERLLPQIGSHVETLLLPDQVFRGAVATETPQGVAALVKLKEHSLDAVLEVPVPLFVGIAGIQDPGNLGTIIRSAEAFGAHAAFIGENTVAQFNPKVLRAAAGSLFRLPVFNTQLQTAVSRLREAGVRIVGTSSHKGKPLNEVDLTRPLALFIGSEGTGMPREILSEMDENVMIPHSPRVESLNAGVAASILLYEASRQRSGRK
ncbi:MAG TPA: RNA methyltransferase [Terriglobales bacterium]|nr:RNA methyltransferase [Terriglobales bacterium]